MTMTEGTIHRVRCSVPTISQSAFNTTCRMLLAQVRLEPNRANLASGRMETLERANGRLPAMISLLAIPERLR